MMTNRLQYCLVAMLFMLATISSVRAEDFNPADPPEPMLQRLVSISADPAAGTQAITFGGSFSMGRTITISVTPASGYRFLYWTLDGVQYSTNQSFDYTIGDNNVSFVAKLAKNPVVTVSVSPAAAGSASGGGTYKPGDRPRIRTNGNSGYTFLYWTLNGEQYTSAGTSTSFYYTVGEEDAAFVAVYKDNNAVVEPDPDEPFNPDNPSEPLVYYPVTMTTNLPDGIKPKTIASNGYYAPGKYVSLFVTAPEGYQFLKWTINGIDYSDQASCPYTVGDSAAVFKAHFATSYKIALTASPAEGGTVSGGGSYLPGTKVLLTTSPKSGWAFLYWTLNGERYADAASFYYIVGEKEAAFTAVYVHEDEVPEDPNAPFDPANPSEPLADKAALNIRAYANDSKLGFVSGLPTKPLFEGDEITIEAVSTNADGYYFKQWENGSKENPRTITLSKDANYVATFAKYTFTVTFLDDDQTLLDSRKWDYGDMPSCISPAKPDDESYSYTFTGWQPAIEMVTQEATYTATYRSAVVKTIEIHDGESPDLSGMNVTEGAEIVIEPGGELTVDKDGETIHSLVIMVNGETSGQLHNAGNHSFNASDIYMDYRLDPDNNEASPDQWYAFTVPFPVNIHEGIVRKYGSTSHVYGTDFLIMEYDGQKRANNGKGWKQLTGNILSPGRFYLIGIEGTCNRWLFHKTSDGTLFSPYSMSVSEYSASDSKNQGWNGIGNPTLEHTQAAMSNIDYVCLYNNRTGTFFPKRMEEMTFVVGQPFFIQTETAGSVGFAYHQIPSSVRSRTVNGQSPYMLLSLSQSDTKSFGRMYISLHDEVADTYTIGRDLARMDNSNAAPALWCEAYDTQLAAHGIAMPETEQIIPFVMSVPANGEYVFAMTPTAMENYEVELLCQGAYVATLSASQTLPLQLKAGTTKDYSLRLRKRVATGSSEVMTDDIPCRKVFESGVLYIICDGVRYNAQGQLIYHQ